MLHPMSSAEDGNFSSIRREMKFTMSDNSMALCKNLICGGIAGTTACFIGQPLDLIKIRMQTEPKLHFSAYSSFVHILRNGGYQSFYRGMTAPLCSQFLQTGLMFAGESIALKNLQPNVNFKGDDSTRTAISVFLSGSFGGLLKCIVLVPTDLVKCKMQVDQAGSGRVARYSGTLDCAAQIYSKEGISGLYRGFGVTTLREVPAFGLYFFVYRYSLDCLNNLSSFLDKKRSNTATESSRPGMTTFIAGGLAGSVAWICIYPFDVIKSHIQVAANCNSSVGGSSNATIYRTAAELYRQHGVKAFTRGLGVTIARAFPVNASMLFTHEFLKENL